MADKFDWSVGLPEDYLEHGFIHVAPDKVDAAAQLAHNLAGEGEAIWCKIFK